MVSKMYILSYMTAQNSLLGIQEMELSMIIIQFNKGREDSDQDSHYLWYGGSNIWIVPLLQNFHITAVL